jgi:hypothetical protein
MFTPGNCAAANCCAPVGAALGDANGKLSRRSSSSESLSDPPKNSGVAAFDKMIVQPVSQPGGVRALTPGETVTFNWRSDSSKWTNYKECRLYCRWEVRVGGAAAGAGAARTRDNLPPNLRFYISST